MANAPNDRIQLLEIIAGKDAEILILRAQVLERDAIIRGIVRSTAWRLTYPYRMIAGGIKGAFIALRLLVTNPRQFGISAIRNVARHVRSRPRLRAEVHTLLCRLPESWQRRLVAIAPPPPADIGITLAPRYTGKKELLGDARWVLGRLLG